MGFEVDGSSGTLTVEVDRWGISLYAGGYTDIDCYEFGSVLLTPGQWALVTAYVEGELEKQRPTSIRAMVDGEDRDV